jgi:hypothetical protein
MGYGFLFVIWYSFEKLIYSLLVRPPGFSHGIWASTASGNIRQHVPSNEELEIQTIFVVPGKGYEWLNLNIQYHESLNHWSSYSRQSGWLYASYPVRFGIWNATKTDPQPLEILFCIESKHVHPFPTFYQTPREAFNKVYCSNLSQQNVNIFWFCWAFCIGRIASKWACRHAPITAYKSNGLIYSVINPLRTRCGAAGPSILGKSRQKVFFLYNIF